MEIEQVWRRKLRIPLETPRLLLRPLAIEDTDWLADLFADREVNRFLQESGSITEQARRTAEAVISLDLMRRRFGHWAIQDKTTGDIHGWVELDKLRPWSGPSDEIALSYVLCRNAWGRGIATEAASRLLRHAFETAGLDTVMAVINADNAASRRVLEKLGMQSIGTVELLKRNLEYFRIDAKQSVNLDPT